MRMGAKVVRACDIYPHMGIFDGVVVSRKGFLSVGWEVSLPPVYSCTEDEYDDMLETFAQAVQVLPAWTVVHKQDMYLEREWKGDGKEKSFLGKCYDAHFEGRPYLEHRSYIYVSFGTRELIDKPDKSSGLFGIDFVGRIPDRKTFDLFRNKAREFAAVIGNSGRVGMREMDEEDWFGTEDRGGAVHRYMMLGDDSPVISDVEVAPDRVGAFDREMIAYVIAESSVLPTTIRTVQRVESLSSSQNSVFLSFGSKLGVQLGCEHVVNHVIVVPDRNEILRELDKERKLMFSGAKSSNDNSVNAEEVEEYLRDAYKYGYVTVQAHFDVMAWAREDELPALRSRISSAIASMGKTTAVYKRYNTPVLWYACIPGNAVDICNKNLMKMELLVA